MTTLTSEQIKKINKTSLAKKHGATQAYVSFVLSGERQAKSKKAQAILADAHKILTVLEGAPVTSEN